MKIEQVRLKKTLKAGKNVWVEGSYFPNDQYPSIPQDILIEVHLNTGTVEVTKFGKEPKVKVPESKDHTSISGNIITFNESRESLEVSRSKEKRQIETGEVPQKKSKPKLVRR